MSISNSISEILNIKDENIIFNEDFVKSEKIKGKRSLVFKGYLNEELKSCPNCGTIKDDKLIKYGIKPVRIKMPKVSELNTYLVLKKQVYKCYHCKKKYTSQTNIIGYRKRISNNTKVSVIDYSKDVLTNKQIGKRHNISSMTVQRTNNKIYDGVGIYKDYLPENLCFDEFTYKRQIMAFNFCDAENGKTVDLVEDRTLNNLIKYFSYYFSEARDKVKHIVIDMFKPYITLIKKCFKNAKIIIDMFHIVQLISRSLNKTRIKAMKGNKEDCRKFKRYWRLLLTSRLDLKCSHWKKYPCFKHLTTERDIVDYLLNSSPELKESYNLYQNILYALQHRNYKILEEILVKDYPLISDYMKTSLSTLKDFLPYIKNTLENNLSNGIMERNNNTCKLIKRIAFGFRNFKNFKSRVLIATSLFRTAKST